MPFKERNYLKARRFLNSSQGIAAIQCRVARTSYTGEPKYGYVDADISISDCHRNIMLDFSIHEKKDVAQRLAKIDQLIVDLVKFQTAFKQASADYIKQQEEAAAKKSATKKSKTKKPAVIKVPLNKL